MAYNPYTPPPPTTQPPTSTQYPYGTYFVPGAYGQHTAYPATYAPGAANPYQTGVTSYGWAYQYPYLPQHHQHPGQAVGRPASSAGGATTPGGSSGAQSQTSTQYASSSNTINAASTAMRAATPVATTSTAGLATSNVAAMPQRANSVATFSTYSSYPREQAYSGSSSSAGARGRRGATYKGMFTKELKNLMYGFGDDRNPASDTVNVMEEILVEFILDVCNQAASPLGPSNRKTRLGIEDLRRVLSRPADAKKLARMEELLFMQEDIKRARAEFDDDEMAGAGGGSKGLM